MSAAIPILMYHEVTERPPEKYRKYALTPEAFGRQMRWLAMLGYRTITPDDLLEAHFGRRRLPRRPVILTFDDGYRDCVDNAVPVLKRHGFRAIFYIVAGLVGMTSRWLIPERGFDLPLADWASIKRLDAGGFQIGSHSLTHPHLTELSSAECREQMLESRRLIQRQLGHEVSHFSYPFGSFDDRVRALAEEAGYRSACSVRIGLSSPGDDHFALARVPINGEETLKDFIFRLHTSRNAAECFSRAIRQIRRPLAGPRMHAGDGVPTQSPQHGPEPDPLRVVPGRHGVRDLDD